MSSFISKVELKYQLQQMGIKVVEGNYVRKTEIKKIATASTASEVDWRKYTSGTNSKFIGKMKAAFNGAFNVWLNEGWFDDADDGGGEIDEQDIPRDQFASELEDFLNAFKKTAKFKDDALICYRGMQVSDPKNLIKKIKEGQHKDVGIHWAFDRRGAENFLSSHDPKSNIMLTALIPIKSIDFEYTLVMAAAGSVNIGEYEIRLFESGQLTITNIEIGKTKSKTNIKIVANTN